MREAGLPLLPGTIEPVATVQEAADVADEIGYPLIIKAVGRRRRARHERRARGRATSSALYKTTRATAQAVFKDYRGLHGALPRGAAPHRGAAGLRQPRQRRLLLRARLLRPAPPPEADRGGALDRTSTRPRAATSASAPCAAR